MSTGETVLANLGPVCLWLGTCPSMERSNLAARHGLPGQENPEHPPPRVWEPKPVGEVGAGEAPVGTACSREKSRENLGPKARQEAQGSSSVLSGIPLGAETKVVVSSPLPPGI